MDTRMVNELAEGYRNRTLRLTPQLFSQLGIIKNSISLRLDEFHVSCIPFDLSLSGAKLLAILREQEIVFFEKMVGRPQKLALTRISPYASKPVNFFIPLRVTSLRKPEATSPYCFIETSFGPAPQELTEMLVTYFYEGDQAEKYFAEAKDEGLDAEALQAVLGSQQLALMKDACEAKRLKILYFSPKRLRAFGELEGTLPVLGEDLEFEPFEGDAACVIRGSCVEIQGLPDVPHFYFLGIEQRFSVAVAVKLMKSAKKAGKRSRPE